MIKESELTETFMLFEKSTLCSIIEDLIVECNGSKLLLECISNDETPNNEPTKLEISLEKERNVYKDALKEIMREVGDGRTPVSLSDIAKWALNRYEPKVVKT